MSYQYQCPYLIKEKHHLRGFNRRIRRKKKFLFSFDLGGYIFLFIFGLSYVVYTFQAIEAAIELNLKTVEAGAQGEHKIQRGYLPVTTFSCHYLIDEEFREAIQDFLEREASQV